MKTETRNMLLEGLAALGVIASLVFVGMELRANTLQARAAAFQSIGIAASEWHRDFDDRLNSLWDQAQADDAELIKRWSYADWLAVERFLRSDFRLLEVMLLQVDQGLLPGSAAETLGYDFTQGFLRIPVTACLWPRLSQGGGKVGPLVIEAIEAGTAPEARAECPVDLIALRAKAYAAQ